MHFRACLIWACIGAALAICGTTKNCSAETITQYGTSFQVGELRSTGAGYTTVSVGSHHELVEDAKLKTFVTNSYFSDRDLFAQLSMEQIGNYSEGALAAQDIDSAYAALRAVCEFGDAAGTEALELIQDLSIQTGSAELFKKVVLEASLESVSPKIISVCLATIGFTDPEWVRTKGTRLLYTHADALRVLIREKVLGGYHDGKPSEGKRWIDLLKNLFGAEDAEVKSFQVLALKMQQLTESGQSELSLSDLSQNDPMLRRYLTPLFMEAVHKRAEDAIAARDAQKALLALSQIDQDKRTPHTHSLTAQALGLVPGETRIFFERRNVQEFVSKVALKDTAVMEQYLLCLQRMLDTRISLGYLEEAREVMKLVSQVRPDPNSLNDSLRIDGAIGFLKSGKKTEAKELLNDVQTGVPLFSKLHLAWLKIFASKGIVAFFLVGIVAIFFLLKLVPRLFSATKSKKVETEEEIEEEDEGPRPVFVTARSRQSGFSHEYLEDLYDLGLDQTASLKDIKTAYRNKVKDIHPDHQQHKDADDFLKVKAIYERLLDVRKRMGIDE